MSIKSVMPSNHLILSSLSPPAFNLSHQQVSSNESALCISWPKYWSFSFNISPSNEYSGLISSRMDWLDLFAVQGTLKSLLQPHSSVQFSRSVVSNSATSWTAACQASLTITNSWSLLKLMFIQSVMPSNHLILCRVPFSSCLQSFPASGSFLRSQFFASGGQGIRVSASASVLPMNIQD